ncbi:hypothetical protein [Magnetofaba australis]|uniref:hypothetical protein n=1 Tax=Magnetofaba australis TaxID=1472297 RepID=UPI00117FCB73|nr:hypothetical protein [Magnetofaba australis]
MTTEQTEEIICPQCRGSGQIFYGNEDCCLEGCCFEPCERCQGSGRIAPPADSSEAVEQEGEPSE